MGTSDLFVKILLLITVAIWREGLAVQVISEQHASFVSSDQNEPKYVIAVDDASKTIKNLDDLKAGHIIRNAHGQAFHCVEDETEKQGSLPEVLTYEPSMESAIKLLESLAGLCLYRHEGRWLYELCYKRHVRQSEHKFFHPKETSKNAEEFVCGVYVEDEDEPAVTFKEETNLQGHTTRFLVHTFSDGDTCLLTDVPRTAEVHFTCLKDIKSNVITSVREFPTCNYILTVSTPFLCEHPHFAPQAREVKLINCLPVSEQKKNVEAVSSDTITEEEALHI